MRYFGGCDAGSTYTKCVILDEAGRIAASVTSRSRIHPVKSAQAALEEAVSQVADLASVRDLAYLVGTGYGRNKVPFADENISEISCHAMGVHLANPDVHAIIDIGGQDVKGIAIDTDGTVLNFAMNDKCAAGTGRFFESMANAFELSLEEFSKGDSTPVAVSCFCRGRGGFPGRRGQADGGDCGRDTTLGGKTVLRHGKEGGGSGPDHADRRLRQK